MLINLKNLLFLLQALLYAAAAGTKGSSGNQWNQEASQHRLPQSKGPLGGWDDEVSNPQGAFSDQGWKLEDSVPGVPGQSYPNYGRIPMTNFDCTKQMGPGYYADTEAQCQVFHICQADGRQNSFLCSTGTIFNQETFVCDWWFNVNCADASAHYVRNGNLYRSPHIGIDGSKVSSYGGGSRGSVQQPAVGLPNFDSGSRGDNWPAQPQGQWRANQQSGSQKGDRSSVNQRRAGGGQRWQNRGPGNVRQGGNSPDGGQKGSRAGQNIDQRQQRFPPNQKGGNFQRPVGNVNQGGQNTDQRQQEFPPNQKGGSFQRPMGNVNQGWGQKGMNSGGIQGPLNNQRRGIHGGTGNQGHPNAQPGFRGMAGDAGRQGPRRGGKVNRGANSNKGFDTNTWSIRAQNFQVTSQDRKGSGSDVWSNNYNADVGPRVENSQVHEPWSNHQGGNADNVENQHISQWDENIAEKGKYEERTWNFQGNDYDY